LATLRIQGESDTGGRNERDFPGSRSRQKTYDVHVPVGKAATWIEMDWIGWRKGIVGEQNCQGAGKATALCADVWALQGKNGRPSKIKKGGTLSGNQCRAASMLGADLSLKNYDLKKEHREKRSTALGSDEPEKPTTYRNIQE
jgi:hypothetical protein